MQVDHETLARELLRAVRGRRSQVALSRRIGCSVNTVQAWEAGRRSPAASTFFRVAERVGTDLHAGLSAFAGALPERDPASPEGVATLLERLRGRTGVQAIAERTGRSRFAVSRWLRGQAEPRLPDLLRIVEATSLRLLDFVAVFTDPAALPSTAEAWRRLRSARTLAAASPWIHVVLLTLETEACRARPVHDDEWLAARIGLPVEEVADAVRLLADAGQITWTGSRYERLQQQTIELRHPGVGATIKEHWAEVALARLRAGQPGMFSYNLFTVSTADLERLRELQRAHYRAVRELVEASEPVDHVVLMNLQLVPLEAG